MSVRRLSANQPASFAFTPENVEWAKGQIAKYPEGRQASAIIPLFWQAHQQMGGWLPEPAIRYIADMLSMDYIRALEVATFYTMFNLSPVGENHVQLCGTTPCWLRGADDLKEACRKHIGPDGSVSADGKLSWVEVECLGACANAPMVMINEDYFEDLDGSKLAEILEALRNGKTVKPGPQNGRHGSEPKGELTSLTSSASQESK
ncbi:MAG: NADH-quinone oxidoreductase subunit NuoE [Parvibaculum sp.]|uniref:NADH-quinone oxidoreductase subunit NuoE n=1 Tax=Parvibaculum sp. TaxID=2024848 RepID=UPI003C788D91